MAEFDEEVDIVVVGSGGGALAGALTAGAQGARTLVLEKTGYFGGTSAYSGAGLWMPGTRVHRREGLDDSVDKARDYWLAVVGDGEPERREAYLTSAPTVVDFLESHDEIAFQFRMFPDYYDAPGRMPQGRSIFPLDLPQSELGDLIHVLRPPVSEDRNGQGHLEGDLNGGRALIGRYLMALRNYENVELRRRTRLESLIVEDDAVVGVEVSSDRGRSRIRARQGVLLSAGGFEQNAEWRTRQQTPGKAEWSMAPRGANTGDAIRAGIEAGAATRLMNEAWWCPGIVNPDGDVSFMLAVRGGFVVDSSGRRYLNESLPYDRFGREMFAGCAPGETRTPSWVVFDSRWGGELPANVIPYRTPEQHLSAGTWVRADTIEELAEKLGMDPAVLGATTERFNSHAASGHDGDFDRGEDVYDRFFADAADQPNPVLVPVKQAPFFAARLVLGDLGTKGGLVTNGDAQVLRPDGSPIKGLYAASNSSANVSGPCYPGPGVPLASAMVYSYRAVRHMADAPLEFPDLRLGDQTVASGNKQVIRRGALT
ncbi:FAD-binding protein [Streptosporangium sp. NPDC051022]|uniref:FAD-binding protein n=1 Tax=Streptosporangium sp. NPDC051022 TaxID=3155752 RepID=UPI00342739DC